MGVATVTVTAMDMAMERGLLRLSPATAMADMAMDMDMATTARGLLMLSPATAMAATATVTAMEATAMEATATTARGPPRPSPATDTAMVMDTATAAMATTVEEALLQRVQFFCDCLRIFNYVPRCQEVEFKQEL